MNVPLPVALVGAGAMASNHARVLSEHPGTRLVVVVDPVRQRAEALATQYGCAWSTSTDAAPPYVAAVVASATQSHPAVAMDLLDADVPLLVEKPLADDLDCARAMVERADRRGLPLMAGFVERFNPAVQTAMSLIESPLLHLTATRHSPFEPRSATSVVWDLLIHDIDLALRLAAAAGDDVATAPLVDARVWCRPDGVPDISDAMLAFSSGAIASLSASRRSQRKNRSLSVATATQLVEIDLLRADVTVYQHVRQDRSDDAGHRAQTVVDIPFVRHRQEPLAGQLEHFLDLIDGRADPAAERATLLAPHVVAETAALEGTAAAIPRPRIEQPHSSPGNRQVVRGARA